MIALSQEKQAIEMQSRKMLEEIKWCKIEVFKEEERALEEIQKLQGSFKLGEELAQKEAMLNAYVKIEKEEHASNFGEDEFDVPAEDGRSEQMDRFLRDLPELKPAVPPLLPSGQLIVGVILFINSRWRRAHSYHFPSL